MSWGLRPDLSTRRRLAIAPEHDAALVGGFGSGLAEHLLLGLASGRTASGPSRRAAARGDGAKHNRHQPAPTHVSSVHAAGASQAFRREIVTSTHHPHIGM